MANLQSLIKQRNSKVLTDWKKHTRLCNRRYKYSCPQAGKCLAKCIVYKAEVTTTDKHKLYYGASDGEFKTRLTTIPDHICTSIIHLILNFPNISGN